MDRATAREVLWPQFGAAIDMLANAIDLCPEELWADASCQPEFGHLSFHKLFWLDLYLTGRVEGFAPPEPFGLEELDPSGRRPERVYTKRELTAYVEHAREKCRSTLANLTPERARERCEFTWGTVTYAELCLYNLRHVQHGAGQLNLALRRSLGAAPRWVGRAPDAARGGRP